MSVGTFELVPSQTHLGSEPSQQEGLGGAVLLHNARWFTRVRWIVVGIFILGGIAGRFLPGIRKYGGRFSPSLWLWILAGFLAVANIVFVALNDKYNKVPQDSIPEKSLKARLWLQILVDLLVVSILVHVIGSTDTFISFAYLFHIALACIFFAPRESFLVTITAACLYLFTVGLELGGIWEAQSILTSGTLPWGKSPTLAIIYAVSAVSVWLVVWYFVSTLSGTVRRREQQLRTANEKLIRADREKNQQMLLTVHDIKAPFAGIENNIQLLKFHFWQSVPDPVRDILGRIDARAKNLRERINAILVLGNLRSRELALEDAIEVDLRAVMEAVMEDMDEKTKSRRIIMDIQVPHLIVYGKLEHYAELFSNLLSNAVSYSYEGESVDVRAEEKPGEVRVSVSDNGIGIRDEALPHIFEEYYRSKEAARFNRMSTGLGLTIVKEIAQKYGMRIKVTSEQGRGTTFEVIIPKKKY